MSQTRAEIGYTFVPEGFKLEYSNGEFSCCLLPLRRCFERPHAIRPDHLPAACPRSASAGVGQISLGVLAALFVGSAPPLTELAASAA